MKFIRTIHIVKIKLLFFAGVVKDLTGYYDAAFYSAGITTLVGAFIFTFAELYYMHKIQRWCNIQQLQLYYVVFYEDNLSRQYTFLSSIIKAFRKLFVLSILYEKRELALFIVMNTMLPHCPDASRFISVRSTITQTKHIKLFVAEPVWLWRNWKSAHCDAHSIQSSNPTHACMYTSTWIKKAQLQCWLSGGPVLLSSSPVLFLPPANEVAGR